jgi:NADPH-dependent curcumin reductase CurA
MAKFGEMTQQLSQYIKDGKIQAVDYEKVVPTQFEDVPSTWQLLFKGDGSSKQGKLVTKVI